MTMTELVDLVDHDEIVGQQARRSRGRRAIERRAAEVPERVGAVDCAGRWWGIFRGGSKCLSALRRVSSATDDRCD